MSKEAVSFQSVTVSYKEGDFPVIDGLSFSINKREFVSLLAPSGSGKSTLFRLLTRLDKPQKGTIFLNGLPTENVKQSVGYMPQRDLLLDWRTVLDNAALPLELQGMTKKAAREKAQVYFNDFGLTGTELQYPHQLSGGMRQRVSFLRAMLNGRDVLLLDEPFSALDAMTRLSMQEWLIDMWKRLNMTILFVTHDIDETILMSDKLMLFKNSPLSTYETYHITNKRARFIAGELFDMKQEIVNQIRQKVR